MREREPNDCMRAEQFCEREENADPQECTDRSNERKAACWHRKQTSGEIVGRRVPGMKRLAIKVKALFCAKVFSQRVIVAGSASRASQRLRKTFLPAHRARE